MPRRTLSPTSPISLSAHPAQRAARLPSQTRRPNAFPGASPACLPQLIVALAFHRASDLPSSACFLPALPGSRQHAQRFLPAPPSTAMAPLQPNRCSSALPYDAVDGLLPRRAGSDPTTMVGSLAESWLWSCSRPLSLMAAVHQVQRRFVKVLVQLYGGRPGVLLLPFLYTRPQTQNTARHIAATAGVCATACVRDSLLVDTGGGAYDVGATEHYMLLSKLAHIHWNKEKRLKVKRNCSRRRKEKLWLYCSMPNY